MYKTAVIYGKRMEITTYERKPEVSRVRRFTKRIHNPFGFRRFDNIQATKRLFVQRVYASIEAFGRPLFCTFTFAPEFAVTSPRDGYGFIRRFVLRLRKEYPHVQGLFVPERHRTGVLHYHALLFGLPETWGDTKRGKRTIATGSERSSRFLASLWRVGFVDCVRTFGDLSLALYLSKYMAKGFDHGFPASAKLYYATRGIPFPVKFLGGIDELTENCAGRMLVYKKYRSRYFGEIIKQQFEYGISSFGNVSSS